MSKLRKTGIFNEIFECGSVRGVLESTKDDHYVIIRYSFSDSFLNEWSIEQRRIYDLIAVLHGMANAIYKPTERIDGD